MNTPSHVILNLVCFTAGERQISGGAIPSQRLAIALGAVLPDLPIFLLYGWAKLVRQQPEAQIWSQTYYLPFWQNAVALLHSIPLAAVAAVIGYAVGWRWLLFLGISMVMHSMLDLPVHHADAHRHFFPFSNYRFISPFSYWDVRHYGAIVSMIERLLVLGGSIYLFPTTPTWWGRSLLIAVNAVYWILYWFWRSQFASG